MGRMGVLRPRQISGEGAGKVSRQTEDVGSFRPLRDAERALYQRPDLTSVAVGLRRVKPGAWVIQESGT